MQRWVVDQQKSIVFILYDTTTMDLFGFDCFFHDASLCSASAIVTFLLGHAENGWVQQRRTLMSRWFESILVHTNSTEIPKYGNHCAGVSPYTLWRIDSNETIVMDVDTSSCVFERTPLYFTTITANSHHYCLTGYDAIYSPTTVAFRIYARSICGWTVADMHGYSQTHQWNVNWMGYYAYDGVFHFADKWKLSKKMNSATSPSI